MSNFIADERLLTIEQAAVYLQVSTRTIQNRVKAGIIKSLKFGKSIRFRKEDLENPVTANKLQTA